MTGINKLVLDKIQSMDLEESDKQIITELFETQLLMGSDRNLKKERIESFRKIITKGVNNENN